MDNIENKLISCYKIYEKYKPFIDGYVADFYVENHWDKLGEFNKDWQEYFKNCNPHELQLLLSCDYSVDKKIPNSLQELLNNIKLLSLCRKFSLTSICNTTDRVYCKPYFWKGVKRKKHHEIIELAKICEAEAKLNNVNCIVDVGSGLGHLSRLLCYDYGLQMIAIDSNNVLLDKAKDLDFRIEKFIEKHNIISKKTVSTVYVNKTIKTDITVDEFLSIVNLEKNVKFGIVGLHPCGNLGPSLLRIFNECNQAVFISLASCCYHKISDNYFISNLCKDFKLTYAACELACHANEIFAQSLTEKYEALRVNAFRAGLEQILNDISPDLRHSHIANVKWNPQMDFPTYCKLAVKNCNINLPDFKEVQIIENQIKNTGDLCTKFHCFRLLFAPLVETTIIYDRLFYVKEQGHFVEVVAAFDPEISPRNFVIKAKKKLNL